MKPESEVPNLFESFYRTKQTAIGGILLSEKMTDLIAALNHLCEKNGIGMNEGLSRVASEIESMLKRMEDINSLPFGELMRLPPLSLSDETLQVKKRDNSDEDLPAPEFGFWYISVTHDGILGC
jgi:hypothetical protein